MSDKHYSLEAAIEHLQRIEAMPGGHPWRLVIRKHNPGAMAGHQTTEVQAISAGFDWEAGRVVIEPAKPLTELTPEQVEDISKSVRTGGSWHAYQRHKKLDERIDALKAENQRMRAALEKLRPCLDGDDWAGDQRMIDVADEALAGTTGESK